MSFGSGPIKVVEKVWGKEFWYANEPEYCMKILAIQSGFQCSLHYHPIKKETFLCVDEGILVEVNDTYRVLKEGDTCTVDPNTKHRFSYNGGLSSARLMEISSHHSDDDVVRLEPSRKL